MKKSTTIRAWLGKQIGILFSDAGLAAATIATLEGADALGLVVSGVKDASGGREAGPVFYPWRRISSLRLVGRDADVL